MDKIDKIIKSCEDEIERLSLEDNLDIIGESYKDMICKKLNYWKSIRNSYVFKYSNQNIEYLIDNNNKIKIFKDSIVNSMDPICVAEVSLIDIINLIDNYRSRILH